MTRSNAGRDGAHLNNFQLREVEAVGTVAPPADDEILAIADGFR